MQNKIIKQDNYIKNNEKINLWNAYGGGISGYIPFIIRPFDTVHMPKDIKRGTFNTEGYETHENTENITCNGPLFTGSNKQQWCSEKNAINYYAMRPIIQADTYNDNLKKMFSIVVGGPNQKPMNPKWVAVNCSASTKSIMAFIMQKVASAVYTMPEMKKNGSWGIEQFHWTDATIFQFMDSNKKGFYDILFNLYNPLRSISTLVEVVLVSEREGLRITFMDFINQGSDKDNKDGCGIQAHNDQYAGIDTQIGEPVPTEVEWNYGNTLLKQEFNEHGFYEAGNNINLVGDVPDSLRQAIKEFENNARSYLMPSTKVNFNGVVGDGPGTGSDINRYKYGANNGTLKSVLNVPNVVYEIPLEVYKTGKSGKSGKNAGTMVQRPVPLNSVVGNIY